MTVDEFLKKYCYNGHDPANCHLRADLEALLAAQRARVIETVRDCAQIKGHDYECGGCCEDMRQEVLRVMETLR